MEDGGNAMEAGGLSVMWRVAMKTVILESKFDWGNFQPRGILDLREEGFRAVIGLGITMATT